MFNTHTPALVGRLALISSVLAPAAYGEPLSLEEAIALAEQRSTEIRSATLALEIAEGELVQAELSPHNPDVSVRAGPALGPGPATLDVEVGVEQKLELGGERADRARASATRRSAAAARLEWARVAARSRARRTFLLAIVERERLAGAVEARAVALEARAAVDERLRLGAATLLEVNVAAAALGRTRSDQLAAERRYRIARTELASHLALDAGADVEPAGDVEVAPAPSASEDELVRGALERRADLRALELEHAAAQADLALAGSTAVPDLGLSITWEHQSREGVEALFAGVSIPIPLFDRNQGARRAALAALAHAELSAAAARREGERVLRSAYRNEGLTREAVLSFDKEAMGSLGENLRLAQESFRAGKIGLLEFNVVRRDLLDTRLAYLDALGEWVEARHTLALASGGAVE